MIKSSTLAAQEGDSEGDENEVGEMDNNIPSRQ